MIVRTSYNAWFSILFLTDKNSFPYVLLQLSERGKSNEGFRLARLFIQAIGVNKLESLFWNDFLRWTTFKFLPIRSKLAFSYCENFFALKIFQIRAGFW